MVLGEAEGLHRRERLPLLQEGKGAPAQLIGTVDSGHVITPHQDHSFAEPPAGFFPLPRSFRVALAAVASLVNCTRCPV